MNTQALIVILNLFILEALLSIDNAAVLAIMVKDLDPSQRSKALRYGIIGAYAFRGLCLFVASWLIKILWLKIVGGLYLLYLVFKKKEEDESPDTSDSKILKMFKGKIGVFWSTVILVEIMDLAFSIDNVFAAVALSDNIWVILTGVFMGILAMRFVAGWFVKIMEKYPSLEKSAFIVIAILGVKLIACGVLDYIPGLEYTKEVLKSHTFDLLFSAAMMGIFFFPLCHIRFKRDNGRLKSLKVGEWLEIYLSFDRLRFEYCTSFYFDQRHLLNTSITTLIGITGLIFDHSGWSSFIWMVFILVPFGKIFLFFPWKSPGEENAEWPQYGFYFDTWDSPWYYFDSIVFCWGYKSKHVKMPWQPVWIRTSVIRNDGSWEHEIKGGERKHFFEDKWKTLIKYESFPYEYTLKNHRVQERIATCSTEEREWRWYWFQWLPLTKKVRRSIAITFNEEIGESCGEWKGGTTGCGWAILPNETVEQCLRRMEKERIFR